MDAWAWFQAEAETLGVSVSDAQRDQFMRFHEILVEANKTTNLTRIVDERDAILKHYLDSLMFLRMVPADWHEKPLRLIDVGAGAGIPGLPLLIMRPHWQAVLLDSVGKKVAFIQEAGSALGLTGCHALHGRAEDFGQDARYRETFDLSVARAVAALPELLELTLPFLRVGGKLVVSKGSKGPEELQAAERALKLLKGSLETSEIVHLPQEAGERHLYVINKQAKLSREYPRKAGIPHRKPL